MVTKSKYSSNDTDLDALALVPVEAPSEPPSLTLDPSDGLDEDATDSVLAPSGDLPAGPSKPSIADVPAVTGKLPVFKTIGAVLVVNPKPTGWRHITAEVASLGYRVDHVSTGAAAALLLANFRYNCVIVETQLPDQDGFDLCKFLRKQGGRRRTASIIVSTSRNPLDRIKSKYAGCDAFISTPVDRNELARTLKRLLPEYILEA
jgi:twitching motility two-component system response regulator PilG